MNYQESLAALESALTFGIDPSLEPIQRMCEVMGNPQDTYTCIQIAGTNGKSSTTRMIAALMNAQGKKAGLYTSPELVRYPERMEIAGKVVSDQDFADAIEAALAAAEKCGLEVTEFELLTAGALWLFAREGVEVAVLECGLGGRWDATSVCKPTVSVITGIGLDHTAILGNTVEEVAGEKAAIIKPGSIAVLASSLTARQVFVDRANEVGVEYVDVEPNRGMELAPAVDHMPLYQCLNVSTAVTAVEALLGRRLELDEVADAMRDLQIPGRFETLRDKPLLLIDASHNPQSCQVLALEIERRFPVRSERPTLLLGVLADKDVRGAVKALVPLFDRIVCTQSVSPRAIGAHELAEIVAEEVIGIGAEVAVIPVLRDAVKILTEEMGDNVLASGSITVAGQVKAAFFGLER